MKGEIHLDEFTVDTNEPVNDMQCDHICIFLPKLLGFCGTTPSCSKCCKCLKRGGGFQAHPAGSGKKIYKIWSH